MSLAFGLCDWPEKTLQWRLFWSLLKRGQRRADIISSCFANTYGRVVRLAEEQLSRNERVIVSDWTHDEGLGKSYIKPELYNSQIEGTQHSSTFISAIACKILLNCPKKLDFKQADIRVYMTEFANDAECCLVAKVNLNKEKRYR